MPRELLVLVAFVALAALMTWPWVLHLRDAVADEGDPYMIAWTLWWDYHQTFNDPLNLFHANVFHPFRYSLAFSENDYGIALLFFPLFALGARPLAVQSVATFLGFAFCGYGAFRLTRTLTGSSAAAWVAGCVFAFIPYRFHLLSHLHYLFAGWLPLLLEALVLFARERTRRRAAWLGVAFLMNALTCITWFILALVPLALSLVFLVVRHGLARDRAFWLRGAAALVAAMLVLLPFLLPYHYASQMYGFVWSREEVIKNSSPATAWLLAEQRNWFWRGFGARFSGGSPLFPGMLPLLLALAAFVRKGAREHDDARRDAAVGVDAAKWIRRLDALALLAVPFALVAAGYEGKGGWQGQLFGVLTADRFLFVVAAAIITRLCIAYPRAFRPAGERNLIDTLRSPARSDALCLGSLWAATGFLMSLGMNSLFYRLVYDHVFLFRSQRIPARAAMLAYVGLAVLAGMGAARVSEWAARRKPAVGAPAVCAALVCLLLFELRAAPLRFVRGAADPDEITLRLKETPMRGGVVELPAGPDGHNHLYMLRAADHARPLVNATSSFVPAQTWEVYELSRATPIRSRLLDLIEELETSYVVVHGGRIAPERRVDYERFLARAIAIGRLRYAGRYGEADDLYAVVRTEPEAPDAGALPFTSDYQYWDALLAKDPVNLLGGFREWGQAVYRLHKASYGRMPRYEEFMPDALKVAEGALVGDEEDRQTLNANLNTLAESWVKRDAFKAAFDGVSDEQYVDALYGNAAVSLSEGERAALVDSLKSGAETRAGVLRKVVDNVQFAEREKARALVLLHYFGYLRRDPDREPDTDMSGFEYWLREMENHGSGRVAEAFKSSGEYQTLQKHGRRQ